MHSPLRGRRRRGSFGQALVEFAIVGPLLLTSIMATVDGGLLLWSNGAANHSAGVGMTVISEEGRLASADTDAVRAIVKAGLGTTPAHIDEIDVYLLNIDPVDGTPKQDGTLIDRYYIDQGHGPDYIDTSRTAAVQPWPPSARNDLLGPTLTYIGLTIRWHYNYLGFSNTPSINLSVSKYFRLEPQQ